MKKFVSLILVILLIAGITGCGNGSNNEEYTLVDSLEELGIIDENRDYSAFIGDWHVYYAALDVILHISEADGNEITFDLIILPHSDGDCFYDLGPYTLPIVADQVSFEENTITDEDNWTKRNHTLTFYDDYIHWATESTWSFVRTGETETVTGQNFQHSRQFRSVSAMPLTEWLQEKLDEVRAAR